MNLNKKVFIATGGTGGHIFPAYSLAKYLIQKKINVEIATDKRGLRFLKDYPEIRLRKIYSATIFKKNLIKSIFSLFVISYSILNSLIYFIFNRPNLVFGMGGYFSFPICLAAKLLKIKVIIYENNLVVGKANKYLLPFVDKIFIAYKETNGIQEKYNSKIFKSGNIIREEILNYTHQNNIITNNNSLLKILILGGSQAAKSFGEKIPNELIKCKKDNISISVFQQCLTDQNNQIEELYKKNNISYELFNFKKNILDYFKKVDLVITRSGSSILAELLNCKIPIISIPLPNSADNHQHENAKYFLSNGYSFLINESNLENKLFELIKSIYKDKSILEAIVKNQKKYNDKNVFDKIYKELNF
jgi:UDP-N-acetylglucosamine--N-acetylmuramyl-(pentapeptide) pyrophosphoryl-undecaprenol N-acetylglucosamine transferase